MSDAERKSGVDLIAEERRRQIDHEGWTPEHAEIDRLQRGKAR